ASALYVAGDAGRVSVANFTGSALTNVSGPTIGIAGLGNVSMTNSTVSGSGDWLRVGTIGNFAALGIPAPSLPGIISPGGDPPAGPFTTPAPLTATAGLANVTLTNSTVTGSAFTA